MKNVLIWGPLPKTEKETKLYELIVEISKRIAKDVRSPIDTAKFDGTCSERYNRAFETVKEADLIIGEQSLPSTGQGMEIRECAILNKPLIIVAKIESQISGLIKGCPTILEIIYYENLKDLKLKLENSINKLNT